MSSDNDAARWIEVGRIGRPHGLKGGLHVESHTEPVEGLLKFRRWQLRSARNTVTNFELLGGRRQGEQLVVMLKDVTTRDAAVPLVGATIEVQRAEMPATAGREHYRSDLIGMRVSNLEGVDFGVLDHFIDAPAHPVMVIRSTPSAELLERCVPAIAPYLQRVDVQARCLWVDWPADF